MRGEVEVFRSKDGQYCFHVKAGNGEIVASSEGYRNRADCVDAAGLVADGRPVVVLPDD